MPADARKLKAVATHARSVSSKRWLYASWQGFLFLERYTVLALLAPKKDQPGTLKNATLPAVRRPRCPYFGNPASCPTDNTRGEDWIFLAPGLAHTVLIRVLSITPAQAMAKQTRRMFGVEP